MNRYLYFAVFSSGMTTLALELTASRLLGVAFGTSNLVWASIIGLILIYLTLGYFIGGWWADRSPQPETMYKIMAWAAFTAGLAPLIARPVLTLASNAFDQLQIGVLAGSFTAVLILFSVPVTLLGTISPFAIRLAITDSSTAGKISGRIYAISTLGSFVGTFLPVLILIPVVGTTLTFIIFSAFLLLVALTGLWLSGKKKLALSLIWMVILLILFAVLTAGRPLKTTVGQIYEKESAYNYIQVVESDGYRLLRLNEGQGVHSVWHPDQLDYAGPWEQFLAAPFLNQPQVNPQQIRSMAVIGLAAGTVARQASEVFGPIPIDGYEIDGEIIRVGQIYFEMNLPNLTPIAQDGRLGLAQSERSYSIIGIDAYQPPYIPWHLTTQEFFQLVFKRLDADGVLVINVGRSPADRSLVDGLVGTVQSVFPSVYVMDVPNSFNSIVFATVQPTQIQNLYDNLLFLYTQPETHPLLITSIERFVINQQPTPESKIIFTDDWAPVEWMTNQMVLNYVLFGDVDVLRGP
ncbi:MAG TPA: fused MFS/spermidine synthase [Anaerolineales bacterium]|nr:fused MFS/spermidine synthase [Anaerolineales bacterium]